MSGPFGGVIDSAIEELRTRSKQRIYQNDFDAWSADVLGRRYYDKLNEATESVVHGTSVRTAVKSANGCGKSMWLADLATWWVTVFPPEESLVICTAPTLDQIERVLFKYLKDNYGYNTLAAKDGGVPKFPGWINESMEWQYKKPDGSGNEVLIFGKRPSDKDIVSTFQGTRKLRTFVAIDEGGGVPADIFTATEAVATGAESRTVTIGNPDKRGTEFHRIFTDQRLMQEWNLHTISAYDLPTMTGEIVYADKVKQAQMLKGLTQESWIRHKERVWMNGGVPDARFKAKVLGEFPGETDNSFFPQDAIDHAFDTAVSNFDAPKVLGADLASSGADESVVYINKGGHVRLFSKSIKYDDGGEVRNTTGVWSQEDEVTSARRIHAIAMNQGVDRVQIDAAGLGGGVYAMLNRLPEFAERTYDLIAIKGANSSTDRHRWNRRKEQNYDNLRRMMMDGLIDLDPNDTELRDELLLITYDLDNNGAIKMTPKRELRNIVGGSPDRVDALVYACADIEAEVYGRQVGEVVTADPLEFLGEPSSFYDYVW